MLMIRLQRVGRKHDPSFRVVVTDKRNGPQSGKVKEIIGTYDARGAGPKLKTERVKYWLGVGAQPSGTVHNFLVDKKILSTKKVNVLPKRKPVQAKVEEAKAEEPKAEPKAEAVETKTEETPAAA